MQLMERISHILNVSATHAQPLHGGSIGDVYRVDLADGTRLVAKVADEHGTLHIEGEMLRYLRNHSALPVPEVLHSAPELLVMTYIDGNSHLDGETQHHAAELIAALHSLSAAQFGFAWDTLIGGLHQPNPLTESWLTFFQEHRLRYMAEEALRAGRLPARVAERLYKFADDVGRYLNEPPYPALLHGDLWTTNILAKGGRITGFVDPAIYYGHPEIELAFSTLFGTMSTPFFNRYKALRPIEPGFFETRRDIYNLYPLLVHVRLFGGSYVASVDEILRRFGF
ncbi:MAG: fructosamine kinase family protein [Anaerolineae bacterium]